MPVEKNLVADLLPSASDVGLDLQKNRSLLSATAGLVLSPPDLVDQALHHLDLLQQVDSRPALQPGEVGGPVRAVLAPPGGRGGGWPCRGGAPSGRPLRVAGAPAQPCGLPRGLLGGGREDGGPQAVSAGDAGGAEAEDEENLGGEISRGAVRHDGPGWVGRRE